MGDRADRPCCRCAGLERRSRSRRLRASTSSPPTRLRPLRPSTGALRPHDVEMLNSRRSRLDFADVEGRLPEGASEQDWLLLRGNLERLSDFSDWFEVIAGEIAPPELDDDDRALVGESAKVAANLDWSNEPWRALADALKTSTGLKGKALFHPLRLALTGRESGPEMAGLLERMGQDRAVARLSAASRR